MAARNNNTPSPETVVCEPLVNIEDICYILKLKKSYVYLLTHEKRIPHYKVNGHLRFRVSEIDQWLAKKCIFPENKKIEF